MHLFWPSIQINKKRIRVLAILMLGIAIMVIWNRSLIINLLRPSLIAYTNPNPSTVVKDDKDGQSLNEFIYPRLGINAPLTDNPKTSPTDKKDWPKIHDDLEKGVSLTYTSESFLDTKLSYITGHSTDDNPTNKFSSVFASLGQAQVGDEFMLLRSGEVSQFKVVDRKIVNPRNVITYSEEELAKRSKKTISLVTCWPLFTSTNRLVVIGELQ